MREKYFYLALSFVLLPTCCKCPAQLISKIPNAPFTATQTLVSNISGKQTTETETIARRSDGSTYTRFVSSDGANGEVSKTAGIATIQDVTQHQWIKLYTGYRSYTVSQDASIRPRILPANYVELYMSGPRLPVGTKRMEGNCELTILGDRKIQGLDTAGSSFACPNGQVSETWYSPLLDLDVEKKIHQTTPDAVREITFTEIRLGEPDPILFEIPAGFTEAGHR